MTIIPPMIPQRAGSIGVLAAALLFNALPVAAASSCMATSGRETVPLVELFTSEGCDSCPPADRWLASQFPPARGDAATTVLAFHVDYWDRLGWKDRFATAQYTQRQYEAMRANGATFVYTPQVLVQGHDAASWQRGGVPKLVDAARQRVARASVTLDASADSAHGYAVRAKTTVPDKALRPHAVLWLAYADSGLVSDVKAGENRGVRLTHDYVVRTLAGPYAVDANGEVNAQVIFARPAEGGTRPALVAVVQDGKTGEVLQTLTLPACGDP